MLGDLRNITDYFSIRKKEPGVDSWVFQWVKVAAAGSLLACILVTATAYFGANIHCINGFAGQAHKAIETYCFFHETFSLTNYTPGDVHAYSGVGPSFSKLPKDSAQHAYYQWVPMVLAMQTFVLYFPKWFWREMFEKKRFTSILDGLNKPTMDEADKMKRIQESACYMANTVNHHQWYALKFLACECLAFGLCLANLFFTDAFLGGSFFYYGRSALSYLAGNIHDMNNPLNQVFPKVTKCLWRKFGSSGTIETYDSLCVLPRNIVNEKTYILLWIIYLTSFVFVTIVLSYHFLLLILPKLRMKIISKGLRSNRVRASFGKIKSKLNYGDFWMIKQLRNRMFGPNFEAWVEEFADEVLK